jgi:hypothetical protein
VVPEEQGRELVGGRGQGGHDVLEADLRREAEELLFLFGWVGRGGKEGLAGGARLVSVKASSGGRRAGARQKNENHAGARERDFPARTRRVLRGLGAGPGHHKGQRARATKDDDSAPQARAGAARAAACVGRAPRRRHEKPAPFLFSLSLSLSLSHLERDVRALAQRAKAQAQDEGAHERLEERRGLGVDRGQVLCCCG